MLTDLGQLKWQMWCCWCLLFHVVSQVSFTVDDEERLVGRTYILAGRNRYNQWLVPSLKPQGILDLVLKLPGLYLPASPWQSTSLMGPSRGPFSSSTNDRGILVRSQALLKFDMKREQPTGWSWLVNAEAESIYSSAETSADESGLTGWCRSLMAWTWTWIDFLLWRWARCVQVFGNAMDISKFALAQKTHPSHGLTWMSELVSV